MSRVAVVTGSNKGIGFAIVRALCKESNLIVYLTARDEDRGQAAIAELNKEGLHPKFHKLDINDVNTVKKLKEHLLESHGGLDVLVNNAGIAYKGNATEPMAEQAEVSMATNFWGTLSACDELFPILKSGARVVHISSMSSGFALKNCSPERRHQLLDCKTLDEVKASMTKFVNDTKAGTHKEEGWANSCYGTTKIGVTLMTPIQQKVMDEDNSRPDIVINCCCPGYVDTDMSSHKGHLTIDQGAETPVYLALLPPGVKSPRGEHLSQKQIVNYRAM